MNCINMKRLTFLFLFVCNISYSQTPKQYEVKVQTKGGTRTAVYVTAANSRQAKQIAKNSNQNKTVTTVRKVK